MKNQATLIGRIGNNPDLKMTKNQKPYMSMSLVTSEQYTNAEGELQEFAEWHSIRVWGNLALSLSKFEQKGKLVFVQGPIKYFDDSEEERVIPYIRVDEFKYLERKVKEDFHEGF